MKAPVWLLREVVLATHERLLSEFGGAPGLRDSGLLDSALARPENLQAYGTPTLFELAAAYAFGVVKNHPFIDGNKRTGFIIAVMFLERNGQMFTATEVDATIQTLALAAGELGEPGYASWLKANCKHE
ncbi:MAG: type II toxin-antitoxin system death-on-curing family toxin [Acidobacteriota bacterium]|nr:type II toxin-antitoxin system death-on-curing family toxin [Acidobacteriota bacterium]